MLFVTGKGGVGKTTVAAALAAHLAARRRRVLIVELAGDRGLASIFQRGHLRTEPTPLADRLHGVRVEPRVLLEAYFTRLLRLPFLTRRLFNSITFNAVTAAAPGVTEFLILEHLLQWIEPGRLSRSAYDVVVVDGQATGHALRLLRTPRQLATMVPGGPIGGTARRLMQLLADPRRTQILLVTIADEMAVNETLEARATLLDDLALPLARPVLNRVFPRRFTGDDSTQIATLAEHHPDDPLLAAARLQISARHDAERHIGRLRRAFGVPPISLRQLCSDGVRQRDLEPAGRALGRALFDT